MPSEYAERDRGCLFDLVRLPAHLVRLVTWAALWRPIHRVIANP